MKLGRAAKYRIGAVRFAFLSAKLVIWLIVLVHVCSLCFI